MQGEMAGKAEEALQHLQRLKGAEVADAALLQANYYFLRGNHESAKSYYQKAAAAGKAYAYLQLAELAEEGEQRASYIRTAEQHYLHQLGQGRCSALRQIADALLSTNRGGPYEARAAQWLRAAVKSGDHQAAMKLANLLEHARDLKADHPAARELWKNAAKGADALASYRYVRAVLQEAEHSVSSDELLSYLETAADQGFRPARRLLIEMHLGQKSARPNPVEALKWLELEAQEQEPDSDLLVEYGRLLEQGNAAASSKAQALYRQAASAGNDEALVMLGDYYRYGRAEEAGPIRAYRYYRLAAAEGNETAMLRLSELYRCGVGRQVDETFASRWQELAAYQGAWALQKEAFHRFLVAEKGAGTMPDTGALRQKAEAGDRLAMALLSAVLYKMGEWQKAAHWHHQAVADGQDQLKGWLAMAEMLQAYPAYFEVGEPLRLAENYLLQAEATGSSAGLLALGGYYLTYGEAPERAEKYYKKAAARGNRAALYPLAKLRWDSGDEETAMQLMADAADQGELSATIALAKARLGRGEYEEAEQWLKLAEGVVPCKESQQTELTTLQRELERYRAVPDQLSALIRRAEAGDRQAMEFLVQAYAAGVGVQLSMEKAAIWRRKSQVEQPPEAQN